MTGKRAKHADAAADATPAAAPTAPEAPAATEPGAAPAVAPASVDPAPAAPTTNITAGPGGVMTDEVGVITGDLTLRSELSGDQVTLRVQYLEAAEWYVVTGGRATLRDPADLEAVHKIAVGLLDRPEG